MKIPFAPNALKRCGGGDGGDTGDGRLCCEGFRFSLVSVKHETRLFYGEVKSKHPLSRGARGVVVSTFRILAPNLSLDVTHRHCIPIG